MAVDSLGNIYISNPGYYTVRRANINGLISTVAGRAGVIGSGGDGGPATMAALNMPVSVALDKYGNVYIADQGNNYIRKVDTNGIITRFAGNGL